VRVISRVGLPHLGRGRVPEPRRERRRRVPGSPGVPRNPRPTARSVAGRLRAP